MNKDVYISNLVYYNRFTSEQLNSIWESNSSKRKAKTGNIADTEVEQIDIANYMRDKKFCHNDFATDLMQQYHFITLNTLPHFYSNGLYVNNNGNRKIEKLIKKYLPSLGIHNIKEVLNDLALSSEDKEETDYHTLAFKNGLVNIESPELQPFSPDVILTSRLNVDFVEFDMETCSNTVVDTFFSDITDRR